MENLFNTAKRAGFFYLVMILGLILSDVVRTKLIIPGDAVTTYNQISDAQGIFRVAFFSELISTLFFLLAGWALYVILKPVNQNLAFLFFVLLTVGVAIESINTLNLFAVMILIQGSNYMSAFTIEQVQSFAMFFLNLYDNGFIIAQIFFGTWLFPLGYLVYKSGYFPKWLGVLLMVDCFGILIWFFQFFTLPAYPFIAYPGFVIGFTAEFSLSLWLLIKGIDRNVVSVQMGR